MSENLIAFRLKEPYLTKLKEIATKQKSINISERDNFVIFGWQNRFNS